MGTAAAALGLGWADPFALLRLGEDDWTIAVAVVNRAAEDRAERVRQQLNALAVTVQVAVVRAFGGGERHGSPDVWLPPGDGDD